MNNALMQTVEFLLHKYLKTYFLAIFTITAIGSFYNYLSHHPYKIGDWLINYQGGGIRRGFLGEFIYQLSVFTNISPGFYVFIIQSLLYFIFLYCSYLLLKRQEKLLPFSILILSPFIFTFQVNDLLGGYRKEIIYIAILAFITWSANFKSQKTFERIFYSTLLLYPLVILTHEMLAIYLPYIILIYILNTRISPRKLFFIFLALIPSLISFLYTILNPGNEYQVGKILASFEQLGYSIDSTGAVEWLRKGSSHGISQVIQNIDQNYYILYLINISIAMIAFKPFSKTIEKILVNRLSLLLILSSMIGSLALFIVAVDWGRFIYIHLVSFFFMLFTPFSEKQDDQEFFLNKLGKKPLIAFFTAYSLLWHIPHAGSVFKKTFTRPNFIAYFVPIIQTGREIYRIDKQW